MPQYRPRFRCAQPGLSLSCHPNGESSFPLFFFSSRRRHTRSLHDWSSDVCSSDLVSAAPTATFSQAVTPGTVSFTVKDPGGNSVAGSVALGSGNTLATFTPSGSLAAGTAYTATVSGAQNSS